MNVKEKKLLKSLARPRNDTDFGVDDLQGLLLQISFAIMMIFMIAYFMFKSETRREQEEQILELERQKLALAVDTVNDEYRARYGLSTLISSEANAGFDAASLITDGTFTTVPLLRGAFISGTRNSSADFAEPMALRRSWLNRVAEVSELPLEELSVKNLEWLNSSVDSALEKYYADVKTVNLSCAAEFQKHWMKHPSEIEDPAVADILKRFNSATDEGRLLLVTELSAALRSYSFRLLSKIAGAEVAADM